MKRKIFVALAVLLSLMTVSGKVIHLRPGVELPVMISISMQNILDNSSVSGFTWSTPNSQIFIRSKSKYACTLYTNMLAGGEATLKYWVTYLSGYRSQDYEYTWTIKVSPLGDKSIWYDIQEGDYFQDYTEEDHLMLFQLNTRWNELCADVASYPNGNPCLSKSVTGKVTVPAYVQRYPVLYLTEDSFNDLSEITDLILPSTLKSVDKYFIKDCYKLKTLTCLATTPPNISWGNNIDDYFVRWNTVLYVPKGCKNKYKEAKGWKDFDTIKEIGEEIITIPVDETHFPDDNFRKYLLDQDYGKDGKLTEPEIDNITSLELIARDIKSLKGIEFFTSLKYLFCSWNSLGSLDLSQNTGLRELECVHCNLASLDLSRNTALVKLDCSTNYIKGSEMDKLINCLPYNSNGEANKFYVRRGDSDNNVCTKIQVATAKAKGWKPYFQDKNNNWIEYDGSDAVITIDATNFPDDNFRKYLLEQDYGKDGVLTEDELAKVNTIDVSGSHNSPGKIVSLQGVEFFSALKYLYCYDNLLTSLDVSKNTALTDLSCSNNQLFSLDVSKNTALTRLYCFDNQLTTLDVSKNTALRDLSCYNNNLTSLDVSKNTVLLTFSCDNNQLTSLDVSKNTALTNLYCYNNLLTSLDVSNNTLLSYLECNYNQLTSLDVSKNILLTSLSCSNNQLFSLDVTKNTALKELKCSRNNLISLNLSKNTVLEWLKCEENELTSLDLSNNKGLYYLCCYDNIIKGIAMDNLINSLHKNTTGKEHQLIVIYNEQTDGNVCTTTQVNSATSKGWSLYKNYPFNIYTGCDLKAFGDVTGDGKVDSNDFDLITKYIMKLLSEDEIRKKKKKFDINGDRRVDVSDLTVLVNLMLYGKIRP